MLKDNLLTDTIIEEVDLGYTFMADSDELNVYVKFTGFNNSLQMEQFAEYMKKQLPLLFTSTTKH
jgi:hypothetical protein